MIPTARAATVTLRPATDNDSAFIRELRADERSRRYSRHKNILSETEHADWMRGYLDDPARFLMIIVHDDESAGVFRLDPHLDGYEVSVLVAPDRYRLGIGGAALRAARGLFPNVDLWAEVLPGNDASHALFQGAGYERIGFGRYVDRASAVQTTTASPTDDGHVEVTVPEDGKLTIPEAALLSHALMDAAEKALKEWPNGHEGARRA